jgi:hypothetical protein
VLIGRVGSDDFAAAAAAHGDATATAAVLRGEYERIRALGGVYALSYHSQLLANTRLVPALASMARTLGADSAVWVATLGQIAEWWRGRAHLDATVRTRDDGFELTVHNRGERQVRGAVVRVELPTSHGVSASSVPRLPAEAGSVRLQIPPLPGNTTRVYTVDYDGARRMMPTRGSNARPRTTPRKRKRVWWFPFLP